MCAQCPATLRRIFGFSIKAVNPWRNSEEMVNAKFARKEAARVHSAVDTGTMPITSPRA
jgi:hypothetical protein